MELVAVIVAKDCLPEQALANVRAKLPAAQEPIWLCHDKACEIRFSSLQKFSKADRREMAAQLAGSLNGDADIGIFEETNRRKKLLVADMDSTIIEQECLDELAGAIGIKGKVAAITERAMRGDIDFTSALSERVALLKGLPLARLRKVIDEKITFTPGARTLVSTMKADGALTALVSGGFTLFTQHVAETLGFDLHFSNRLECQNDALTGKVMPPVFAAAQKRETLLDLCRQKNIEPQEALAIGDGANDVAMLEAAGSSIAFRAKPVAVGAADAQIAQNDLTIGLYYQGYHRNLFQV